MKIRTWRFAPHSLAISEAFAGSDVMGMKTTATLSEDGKHYIVNGTKKWITNGEYGSLERHFMTDHLCLGTFSDYFTVGCRSEVSNRLAASCITGN